MMKAKETIVRAIMVEVIIWDRLGLIFAFLRLVIGLIIAESFLNSYTA